MSLNTSFNVSVYRDYENAGAGAATLAYHAKFLHHVMIDGAREFLDLQIVVTLFVD